MTRGGAGVVSKTQTPADPLSRPSRKKLQNTEGPALEKKECRKCGREKPVSEFPVREAMRDGLSSWCADCHNDAVRETRARQDEAARESQSATLEAHWAQAKRGMDAWRARIEKERAKRAVSSI
jgi:hypothetical protein